MTRIHQKDIKHNLKPLKVCVSPPLLQNKREVFLKVSCIIDHHNVWYKKKVEIAYVIPIVSVSTEALYDG